MTLVLSSEDREIFDEIDRVIERSVVIGDPTDALEFGNRLRRRQELEGKAMARFLYCLRRHWEILSPGDDFYEAVSAGVGIRPVTAEKYINMWESIFENPQVSAEAKELLLERPIGDLLLLTAAIAEGSLGEEGVREAALAADRNEVRAIVRKARGEHTSSSSAVYICLNRVDRGEMVAGTLYARRGEQMEVIGLLYVDRDSELVQRAIQSLLNTKRIIEVWNG